MSTARSTPKAAFASPKIPGFEAFAQANQSAIDAISHIGVDNMQRMLQINAQYLDFIRHRLEEDMATTKRIRESGTMPEVVDAVTDFYKLAFDEYAKEMVDLSEMAVAATAASITETEEEAANALKAQD